ncbi:MAG: helix-turn-helix transcriptional regulator [Microgenomates group bacterium]
MKKFIPPEKRKHQEFSEYLKEKLKDPEFKHEFDKLQPEFEVVHMMYEARLKKNFTQKQLAEKLNTKKSVISRLEAGNANPTLNFLKRFADALDTTLQIKFIKNP